MLSSLELFQEELRKRGLEAYILHNPINISYLTNYQEEEGFLLVTTGKVFFLTDFRYVEGAILKERAIEVKDVKSNYPNGVLDIILALDIRKVCFEGSLSYLEYAKFQETLKSQGLEFIVGPKIIEQLRMIKSKKEKDLIRTSAKITDEIFMSVLNLIKPGITEIDLKNELEFQLRNKGATCSSFDLIVASGSRSSLPHGVAMDKKIVYNEPILFDIGVLYKGYASDMTRMVFLGQPDQEFMNIYQHVYEAQKRSLETIVIGASGAEIDLAARDYLESYDLAQYFGHSTGHGVGRNIHEAPTISERSRDIIEEGMVFSIEPGVYLENKFGVRIEDLVMIDNGSLEVLSKTKKELIVL